MKVEKGKKIRKKDNEDKVEMGINLKNLIKIKGKKDFDNDND